MNWLKDHEYLAVWMSLPIMMIIGLVQGIRIGFEQVKFGKFVIYLAFLTCLGAVFTPIFDDGARFFAGGLTVVLMIYIMIMVADSE